MNIRILFAALSLALIAGVSGNALAQDTTETDVYDGSGTIVVTQPTDETDGTQTTATEDGQADGQTVSE